MEQMKRCSNPECGQLKPISEFDKNPYIKRGYFHHCKTCRSKYNREYKSSHKGRAVEALSSTRKSRRMAEKVLGRPIKDTLTSQQIAFVLSEGECLYCRKELDYFDATIDHVLTMKSGKGDNTYDNILCACSRCNKSKNDRPVLTYLRSLDNPLQLRRVIDRLAQRQGIGYFEMWSQLNDDITADSQAVTTT